MAEKENTLLDFIGEFIEAFESQLESDHKRWGNTWMHRPKEGQELRIEQDFNDYFDKFKFAGTPVPWLKVIGNAYIAWVRENYSDG